MARADLDVVVCPLAKQIHSGAGKTRSFETNWFSPRPGARVADFIGDLTNAAAFLFNYASITYAAVFMGNLTMRDNDGFLPPLQPKSGFLPEAGRGRPKLLKVI